MKRFSRVACCFAGWIALLVFAQTVQSQYTCSDVHNCDGTDTYCSEECASACSGIARSWHHTVSKTLMNNGNCSGYYQSQVDCYDDATCSVQTYPNWNCKTLIAGQTRCDGSMPNPNGSCGQCSNITSPVVTDIVTYYCGGCMRNIEG